MIQFLMIPIMILIEYMGNQWKAIFYAKIAWSSDLLQPEFLKIYPKVYAIGIDQILLFMILEINIGSCVWI